MGNIGMMFASAPIKIKAEAMEARLLILKALEPQEVSGEAISVSPDMQAPQS